MFVKSQDGVVVLNNDKVTEYSTDSKYDGRYKVAALVGENRVVIGRYSTKEKCRMAISMLMDCYTMNLLFERGQDESEYTGEYPYTASSCIPDGSKRRTDSNESLRWCDGRNQEEQALGETEETCAYCPTAEGIYGFPERR